jgi:hypothetical protein
MRHIRGELSPQVIALPYEVWKELQMHSRCNRKMDESPKQIALLLSATPIA